MYNSNHLKEFIEKVSQEAEAAANEVFKKYDAEFKRKVEAQLGKGEQLYLVNGSGYIKGRGDRVGEKPETEAMRNFVDTIAHIQYLEQRASFNTYEFTK
jgi:nucleoid DNA-binding protein